MNTAATWEAKNVSVNVASLRQTGPLDLPQNWVTPHKRNVMLSFVLFFSQKRFCGVENTTGASVAIGVSSKWVKLQF